MHPKRNLLQKAVETLQNGRSGVICLPKDPKIDTIASATSLYLGLAKLGKNIALACATAVDSQLTAADKIQSTLATSGDNLVISFPYTDGSVDKVDYYIQGERFNIVVIPGSDSPKLEKKDVAFSSSGGSVDFIITIDCENIRRLGDLYSENQEVFKTARIINIDRHLTNSFFGGANVVDKTASSTSELILKLLEILKSEIDADMATNLYAGLVASTNNFSSHSITPETFETAAYLLKLGAKKRTPSRETAPAYSGPSEKASASQKAVKFEQQREKPIEEIEREEMDDENMEEDDWLRPKIFKSGSSGENS